MKFYKIIWHINCWLKKLFFKLIYGNRVKFGKNVQFRKRFNLSIENSGKVIIGDNTFFNNDCSINAMNEIEIGNNCLFGENVKIYDHNHKFRDRRELIEEQGYSIGKVVVGNNCWICSNDILLKNSNIGNNCVIGANCIVDTTIKSNTLLKNKNLIEQKEI